MSDLNLEKIDERKALIREYKQLDTLERRGYSYNPPNSYKTVFMTLMGILGIGCFGILVWLAGHKSGKDRCKR